MRRFVNSRSVTAAFLVLSFVLGFLLLGAIWGIYSAPMAHAYGNQVGVVGWDVSSTASPAQVTQTQGSGGNATRHMLDVTLRDSTGAPTTSGGSSAGRTSVALVRNDYTVTPVTTSAYVQLVASLPSAVNAIQLYDSSGQTLALATGASGHEVQQLLIPPGSSGSVSLAIPSGTRVSIEAVSATASTGEFDATFLQ